MKWIRTQALARELLAGTFLNLGSSLTAEIAGRCGFDWLLIDLEHGAGDQQNLLAQLQAVEGTRAAPVVRVGWNDATTIKRILDLGPSGIMVPYVNTAEEAARAVAAMQYPPQGVRGVAKFNRACGFTEDFEEYFQKANENLLTVVQIETAEAVANAEAIAAGDGVDVLFVGPLDLSVNLGIPSQFEHPEFVRSMQKVAAACAGAGKAAGTLASGPEQLEQLVDAGFTFIACGSDGGAVTAGLKNIAAAFNGLR